MRRSIRHDCGAGRLSIASAEIREPRLTYAQGGVHVHSRGNEALPTDLVKLLKTQDVKYVRSQRTSEERVRSASLGAVLTPRRRSPSFASS